MRKTKIVATMGPATADRKTTALLIQEGVNVFRLNFSHGTLEEHKHWLDMIREESHRLGKICAVLGDLPGPKLRIGEIAGGEVELQEGSTVRLVLGEGKGDSGTIFIEHEIVFDSVSPGENVFINDGLVRLRVERLKRREVFCHVEKGGHISSRKGLNIPHIPDQFPSLTERDIEILEDVLGWQLDYLALSFVRSGRDINVLREKIQSRDRDVAIVAKIEKPQALENLKDIIHLSDGIMVARGDLGVEIPIEEVPFWQKKIILECRREATPVIVATQMLESMIRSPIPTRAEITDVAGAIYDGTDAVMLSGETAVGEYPVDSVRTASRVAAFTEQNTAFASDKRILFDENVQTSCAVSLGAIEVARRIQAAVIVTFTYSGSTAQRVSSFRPHQNILALSPQTRTVEKTILCYGVLPRLVSSFDNQDRLIEEAYRIVREMKLAAPGDRIVITGGVPLNLPGFTNFLQVETL